MSSPRACKTLIKIKSCENVVGQSGGVGFRIGVTLVRLNERVKATPWVNSRDYMEKTLLKLIGHV